MKVPNPRFNLEHDHFMKIQEHKVIRIFLFFFSLVVMTPNTCASIWELLSPKSKKACNSATDELHGRAEMKKATFEELFKTAFGQPFLDGENTFREPSNQPFEPPEYFRVDLKASHIEGVFQDRVNDPFFRKWSNYIVRRMESNDLTILITNKRKLTNFAVGKMWHSSEMTILFDPQLIGYGRIAKNGFRSVIRSIIIHEAFHGKLYEVKRWWLEKHGLHPSLATKLNTVTEEYLARKTEAKSLGSGNLAASLKAFLSTFIDAGENPFEGLKPLFDAWEDCLKKEGVL